MEVRKWTTVDVFFNQEESHLALRERKRLEKLGYELQEECEGTDNYECDDQYIKNGRKNVGI
jgi:hypothetical protein